MLEIPLDRLTEDTLQAIIEEYIAREGTDYGWEERTLESKVAQLKRQLSCGDVVICFDPQTESCTLLTRREYTREIAKSE